MKKKREPGGQAPAWPLIADDFQNLADDFQYLADDFQNFKDDFQNFMDGFKNFTDRLPGHLRVFSYTGPRYHIFTQKIFHATKWRITFLHYGSDSLRVDLASSGTVVSKNLGIPDTKDSFWIGLANKTWVKKVP